MKADEVHRQYTELLLDRTSSVRYPSKGIMDRLELTLADYDIALEYANTLLEKAGTRYPSLELLDRANRLIYVLRQVAPYEEGEED